MQRGLCWPSPVSLSGYPSSLQPKIHHGSGCSPWILVLLFLPRQARSSSSFARHSDPCWPLPALLLNVLLFISQEPVVDLNVLLCLLCYLSCNIRRSF